MAPPSLEGFGSAETVKIEVLWVSEEVRKKRRRGRVAGGRNKSTRVPFSEEELDAVERAAAELGVGLAAFVGLAAVDASETIDGSRRAETVVDYRLRRDAVFGLMQLTTALGRVGNNVNQIAYRLNASDEVDRARLSSCLAEIDGLLAEADDVTRTVRERFR